MHKKIENVGYPNILQTMLSRKAEDYLEAILNVSEAMGHAKIKYIAETLELTPPSVIEMVKKLDRDGFVTYRKYDGVTLTEKGREVAVVIKDRHDTLKAFLEIVNVPEEIADKDACTMEHELHAITTKQIKNLVNFVKKSPGCPIWIDRFRKFCENGEHPDGGDGHELE